MTGIELARAVRRAKGKVAVPTYIGDVKYYVYAEKRDLAAVLERTGDRESGLFLEQEDGGFYLREEE
jgi:hypothetical protein